MAAVEGRISILPIQRTRPSRSAPSRQTFLFEAGLSYCLRCFGNVYRANYIRVVLFEDSFHRTPWINQSAFSWCGIVSLQGNGFAAICIRRISGTNGSQGANGRLYFNMPNRWKAQ
jgi:hypothetical protein